MRFGNGKLNAEIINKIIETKSITGKQIDVLLWLAIRQDEFGRIFYVKYNEVSNDLNICNQEYYNCINSLEKHNIIRIINRHYVNGWDIEILNNIYISENDDKKRYLNINRNFLYTQIFRTLKANEKKLVLKILLSIKLEKSFFLNFKNIKLWLGITNKQLINSYIKKLKSLKDIFDIKISKKSWKKTIIIKKIFQDSPYKYESIAYHFLYNKIKQLCRLYKVKYTLETLKDTIILFVQYKKHYTLISNVFSDTIIKNHELSPKLINYIVSSKIKAN